VSRKFVFYLKDYGKKIVITDTENSSIEDQIKDLEQIMIDQGVAKFETDNDILMIGSGGLSAIHVIKQDGNPKDFNENGFSNLNDSSIPEMDLGEIETFPILEEKIEESTDIIEDSSEDLEVIESPLDVDEDLDKEEIVEEIKPEEIKNDKPTT